jgi:alcohol dehydrogenase class IV
MTEAEGADAAIQLVRELSAKAGLPATLREIGVSRGELDLAAANALGDAYIVTNPREVSEADARAICRRAW